MAAEKEKCPPHDMQNHSTRYGPVYWCTLCWKTPQEIKQQERIEQTMEAK